MSENKERYGPSPLRKLYATWRAGEERKRLLREWWLRMTVRDSDRRVENEPKPDLVIPGR